MSEGLTSAFNKNESVTLAIGVQSFYTLTPDLPSYTLLVCFTSRFIYNLRITWMLYIWSFKFSWRSLIYLGSSDRGDRHRKKKNTAKLPEQLWPEHHLGVVFLMQRTLKPCSYKRWEREKEKQEFVTAPGFPFKKLPPISHLLGPLTSAPPLH